MLPAKRLRLHQLIAAIIAAVLVFVQQAQAQIEYPFDLPEKIVASIDVDTTKHSPINHMLLGLNCKWPEKLYGKTGYDTPVAQRLIRQLEPSSLRFPHGVWANFYDFESDGRLITDDYVTPYDSSVKNIRS